MSTSRSESAPRTPSVPVQRQAGTLDAMLTALADLIYLCGRSGDFLYANAAGAAVWGLDRSEVIGRTWRDLGVPPDVATSFDVQRNKVLETGQPLGEQISLTTLSGPRLYEYRLTPIRAGEADVEAVLFTLRDFTERRRAEEALRENEEKYRLLAENSTDMISRHDPAGVYLYASPACKRLLGFEPEELVGRSAYEQIARDDLDEVTRVHGALLGTSDTFTVAFRIHRKDGTLIWFETTTRTVRNPWTGEVMEIQCSSRDVSRRKQAEEALREQNSRLEALIQSERQAHQALKLAESQLIQAEKLTALGQLVAGVAHEINNPLAFVNNNIAVLRRDTALLRELMLLYQQGDGVLAASAPALLEQIRSLCERIDVSYTLESLERLTTRSSEGLRRIRQIVGDLRDFARLDESDVSDIDLNDGVRSTVNIISGRAHDHGVDVILELDPLPRVAGSPGKLNQVVLNLLANAIEASAGGGTVTVRTRFDREGQGVVIELSDNGRGIDPAIRDKIFDPFFTTKPVGQGLGLGLSLSYGIIRDHGGTIRVESSLGRGARFTVFLPLRRPASALPEEAERS